MNRRIDAAVAAGFLVFGAFVVLSAIAIPLGLVRDPIGPRSFFIGCAAVIVAASLLTILRHLRSWRSAEALPATPEGVADEEGYPASAKRTFLLFALGVAYAAAFQPLGYLLATPLFLFLGLWLLQQRNWAQMAALSLGFTIVFYVVFAQVLNVRMPVGPLTELFRNLGWIVL